mgnify:FL=1
MLFRSLGGYGLELLPAVVDTLMEHCGWTPERCDRAIADYKTFMAENCIPDYALSRELVTA